MRRDQNRSHYFSLDITSHIPNIPTMNTAFRLSRYTPPAATLSILALTLSPPAAAAKAESKPDIAAVKKSIADVIEDDAER
jgi:hypothetical protein